MANSGIQRLRFVRLLKDFEECSEYENMYNQIDEETKAANAQIEEVVAKAFGGVKFQNEGPSLSLDKGKLGVDSPESEANGNRSPERFSGGDESVPDSEIIYNTQFHEVLDERYEEVMKRRGVSSQGLLTYREL